MESGRLKTLITGASGFLGRHLFTWLQANARDKIIPVARTKTGEMQGCDLCNKNAVHELLSKNRPSRIFHCAGSFTNDFEQDFRNNALTTFHLLQTIDDLDLPCRVLLVGSAAEYGIPETESGFISENHPLMPISKYGLSKACQSQLMGYFHRKQLMNIVMARIFNLDGDDVSPFLFPGHVRKEIRGYLANQTQKIQAGNLSAYRDYLPVNQAVSDLITIMEDGVAGEVYNVGSGDPVLIKDYLKCLLENHNISMDAVSSEDHIESNSTDVPIVAADLTKIRKLKVGKFSSRESQVD